MKTSILTISERIERFLRFCIAYIFIAMLWMLDIVSFGVFEFQSIKPAFSLVFIFYWSVYRPTLMPSWLVFVLGIVLDLITAMPVGLNALLFVLLQRVLIDQRLTFTGQPFSTVFFGYISVAGIFYSVRWLVLGVVQGNYAAIEIVLGQIISGVIFFPLLYLLINLTHKILPIVKSNEKGTFGSIAAYLR